MVFRNNTALQPAGDITIIIQVPPQRAHQSKGQAAAALLFLAVVATLTLSQRHGMCIHTYPAHDVNWIAKKASHITHRVLAEYLEITES